MAVPRFADLPLADRSREWDGGAAERRVREWAGAHDGPNAQYRSAHVWYDDDEPGDFGSYKMLIADVVDGELTVVPRFADLPLADRSREWDGGAAERRVREWAGAHDGPNAQYRSAHVWYDDDEPGDFGSYKMLIADVVDGELTVVPRAMFAAAGVMQGRGNHDALSTPSTCSKGRVGSPMRPFGEYCRVRASGRP